MLYASKRKIEKGREKKKDRERKREREREREREQPIHVEKIDGFTVLQ